LLIAGAPRHGGVVGAAVVYRLDRENGGWEDTGILQPYAATIFHGFGGSVAADNGLVVVGAPSASSFIGTVYAFEREDDSWSTVDRIDVEHAARRDMVGATLAVGNSTAAVAMTGADYGAGAVVVFSRTEDGWVQ